MKAELLQPERSDIPLAYSRSMALWLLLGVHDHQLAELAQLVARPTEDRKVTRSIRVHGTFTFLLLFVFVFVLVFVRHMLVGTTT